MNSQISQQYGFGASMETSVLFHAMKIFVRGIAYDKPATNKKERLCHNKQLINSHFYRGVSELPYKLGFIVPLS